MKTSVNSPCPCGSKKKYKQCCQRYHKGASAKDALTLMKARYSAYVKGEAKYIIQTTHPKNPLFEQDERVWLKSIVTFCKTTEFKKLEVLHFEEEKDKAIVIFRVSADNEMWQEKSYFTKEKNIWLYRNYAIILK